MSGRHAAAEGTRTQQEGSAARWVHRVRRRCDIIHNVNVDVIEHDAVPALDRGGSGARGDGRAVGRGGVVHDRAEDDAGLGGGDFDVRLDVFGLAGCEAACRIHKQARKYASAERACKHARSRVGGSSSSTAALGGPPPPPVAMSGSSLLPTCTTAAARRALSRQPSRARGRGCASARRSD